MKNNIKSIYKSEKGFTLIELLVVISIIGLLSTVVLASLSAARLKAKDSLVISEVDQLTKIMEFEHLDSGSYAKFQPLARADWTYITSQCDSQFPGSKYSSNLSSICKKILQNNSENPDGNNGPYVPRLSIAQATAVNNAVYDDQKYSIMAWLPGKEVYYCSGSSGKSYIPVPHDGGQCDRMGGESNGGNSWWGDPGCFCNP